MLIPEEEIEAVKRSSDLISIIESRGIRLEPKGKNYIGLCPFHKDTNPSLSVNPSTRLWKCFGCNAGGDVIRFVELFDKVDFREAVRRLGLQVAKPPGVKAAPGHYIKAKVKAKTEARAKAKDTSSPNQETRTSNQAEITETRIQALLERTITIYEKNFTEDTQGKSYLEARGITDAGLFTRYRVGFCNGRLKEILPGNGNITEELKSIGILLANDLERFNDCVVFPVYDLEGRIITLYGRTIHNGTKRHLFLPHRAKGLWNIETI